MVISLTVRVAIDGGQWTFLLGSTRYCMKVTSFSSEPLGGCSLTVLNTTEMSGIRLMMWDHHHLSGNNSFECHREQMGAWCNMLLTVLRLRFVNVMPSIVIWSSVGRTLWCHSLSSPFSLFFVSFYQNQIIRDKMNIFLHKKEMTDYFQILKWWWAVSEIVVYMVCCVLAFLGCFLNNLFCPSKNSGDYNLLSVYW